MNRDSLYITLDTSIVNGAITDPDEPVLTVSFSSKAERDFWFFAITGALMARQPSFVVPFVGDDDDG